MWGAIINTVVEGCKKKEKHLAMLHFLGLGRVYFCAIFVISMVSVRQCVCIVDRFSFHNMNVTQNCRCWFDFTQTNTLFRQTVSSSVSPVTEHKNVWVSLLTNTLRCCSYTANWKKKFWWRIFCGKENLSLKMGMSACVELSAQSNSCPTCCRSDRADSHRGQGGAYGIWPFTNGGKYREITTFNSPSWRGQVNEEFGRFFNVIYIKICWVTKAGKYKLRIGETSLWSELRISFERNSFKTDDTRSMVAKMVMKDR